MAYATAADMRARFGEQELILLTTGDGMPMDTVDTDKVAVALADASALIDSYLRRRYLTPVSPAPTELVRACCHLARYDLALGGSRDPSTQTTDMRKQTMEWLRQVHDGVALLADATPAGGQSFAQAQDRGETIYGDTDAPLLADPSPTPNFWSGVL